MSAKTEKVINRRQAFSKAVAVLGTIHTEKCGGKLGWLRCPCDLADVLRWLSREFDA